MTFKTALMSATALTMMAGVAFAQSNESYNVQDGDNNDFYSNQSGALNSAGEQPASFATPADSGPNGPILQLGNDNFISINQTGNRNEVGTLEDPVVTGNQTNVGFEQTGDYNRLTIEQNSNRNSVFEVIQSSKDGGGQWNNLLNITQRGGPANSIFQVEQSQGALIGTTNVANINQAGSRNVVGRDDADWTRFSESYKVEQTALGNGNPNVININQIGNDLTLFDVFQQGSTNTANINQSGTDNLIQNVVQYALGNQATTGGNIANIVQGGTNNRLDRVYQVNRDGGARNLVNLTFGGVGNGGGSTGATVPLSGLAGQSGLSQASVVQEGSNNILNAMIGGSGNLFAFTQYGVDNLISGSMNGDNNQLAVLQGTGPAALADSINNQVTFNYDVSADNNNHLVTQIGQDNQANLNITSSNNMGAIVQTGVGNYSSIAQ